MRKKYIYFCENPKCVNHILVSERIKKYKSMDVMYMGKEHTINLYTFFHSETKTIQVCSWCKNDIDLIIDELREIEGL
jgi:hypothetical protein